MEYEQEGECSEASSLLHLQSPFFAASRPGFCGIMNLMNVSLLAQPVYFGCGLSQVTSRTERYDETATSGRAACRVPRAALSAAPPPHRSFALAPALLLLFGCRRRTRVWRRAGRERRKRAGHLATRAALDVAAAVPALVAYMAICAVVGPVYAELKLETTPAHKAALLMVPFIVTGLLAL